MEYHFAMLPLAALIYQHGFLALHASVATNEKGAILIAGDSGAGKSTLLTALNQLGWQVMADDLALVGLNKLGQPIVYPSKFGIALWPDSFKKLGIAPTTLLHSDANRREFIPSGQFTNTPKLLCKIYCLGVHNRKNVVCSEVKPIARFCMINTILYNSHVADVLCDRSEYLRSVAAISRSVPIVNMLRPRGTWSVELLAEVISNPD
jgi:energy-coupling factor transporter ATP-binding protein EcfA2